MSSLLYKQAVEQDMVAGILADAYQFNEMISATPHGGVSTRHLSKSEFETVLSASDCVRHPVEDAVLQNFQPGCLRKTVDGLGIGVNVKYKGQ